MDIKLTTLTENDIELVRKWRNSDEVAKYMYTCVEANSVCKRSSCDGHFYNFKSCAFLIKQVRSLKI